MTRILIVGGYGTVGAQVAQLIAQRHPDLELWLGGRNPDAGAAVAAALPKARTLHVDLLAEDLLSGLRPLPDLVLVAANDHEDRLLRSALRQGLPLIDITRWTTRLRDALVRAAAEAPRAPLVLASSWMAAVPATLAAEAASDFGTLSRIDLDILYALQDRAGPDSVDYLDRLGLPFERWRDGQRECVKPFSERRRVDFGQGRRFITSLFDSPDQITLPAVTGAATVTACIGFDSNAANRLLGGLIRSGLWRAISGPAFARLRRGLLFNPGAGDHHRLRIELQGRHADGAPMQRILLVDDPAGQTHLTAVGALVQVERVLGLCGHAAARPGVQLAEGHTDGRLLRNTLQATGVQLWGSDHRSAHASTSADAARAWPHGSGL